MTFNKSLLSMLNVALNPVDVLFVPHAFAFSFDSKYFFALNPVRLSSLFQANRAEIIALSSSPNFHALIMASSFSATFLLNQRVSS